MTDRSRAREWKGEDRDCLEQGETRESKGPEMGMKQRNGWINYIQ
jgi:hypothetical protein